MKTRSLSPRRTLRLTAAAFASAAAMLATPASRGAIPGLVPINSGVVVLPGGGNVTGTGGGVRTFTLPATSRIPLVIGAVERNASSGLVKFPGLTRLAGTLHVTFAQGFSPQPGDRFDLFDWTGATGRFSQVTLPPLLPAGLTWDLSKLYTTGRISVSMATFFAANKGTYTGIVAAPAPTHALGGAITVALAAGGQFTATLRLGGASHTLRGSLDLLGASPPLAIGSTGRFLRLQLDRTGSTDEIAGTITQGGTVLASLTADRFLRGFGPNRPVSRTGAYTFLLPADPAQSDGAIFPQGTGSGRLVVASAGTVRLAGVLGDGTAISVGALLSKSGDIPVYVPLAARQGSLSGWLLVRGATASRAVEGTLAWSKPATLPAAYPAAFAGQIAVQGSPYLPPPKGQPIFPGGAAIFTISGGNVPGTPGSKAVTVDGASRVTLVGTERFTFRFAAKSGFFVGNFIDAGGKLRSFRGAVLQDQGIAAGLFVGENQTGAVTLQSNPLP